MSRSLPDPPRLQLAVIFAAPVRKLYILVDDPTLELDAWRDLNAASFPGQTKQVL
jgi:hypothetical protein